MSGAPLFKNTRSDKQWDGVGLEGPGGRGGNLSTVVSTNEAQTAQSAQFACLRLGFRSMPSMPSPLTPSGYPTLHTFHHCGLDRLHRTTLRQAMPASQAKSVMRPGAAGTHALHYATHAGEPFLHCRSTAPAPPMRSVSGGRPAAALTGSNIAVGLSLPVTSPIGHGCTICLALASGAMPLLDLGLWRSPLAWLAPSSCVPNVSLCMGILLPYNWRLRSHAVRLRPFPEATATRSLAGLIKTCGGRLTWISLSAARSHRANRTIDLDSTCHAGRDVQR